MSIFAESSQGSMQSATSGCVKASLPGNTPGKTTVFVSTEGNQVEGEETFTECGVSRSMLQEKESYRVTAGVAVEFVPDPSIDVVPEDRTSSDIIPSIIDICHLPDFIAHHAESCAFMCINANLHNVYA